MPRLDAPPWIAIQIVPSRSVLNTAAARLSIFPDDWTRPPDDRVMRSPGDGVFAHAARCSVWLG
jgi:hypothetical protein